MTFSVLVTGGTRSGKSIFAEKYAKRLSNSPVYIATAEEFDVEMKNRIARHKARRGVNWKTVNEPLHIAEALNDTDGQGASVVDCLTIWLNNLIMANLSIDISVEKLIEAIAKRRDPVILVTNEVGSGIVPDNALARSFRDQAGTMNQKIARAVDELYFCVSGISLRVKPEIETTHKK